MMKIVKRRTSCVGCKAYCNYPSGGCCLGYPTEYRLTKSGLDFLYPMELCPRPLTNGDFYEAIHDMDRWGYKKEI